MPVPSIHFQNLRTSHSELVSAYLPNRNPSVLPSLDDQEWARAFVVLIHAEIEFYLESICAEIADRALGDMKTGKITDATVSLLTFSGLETLKGGEQVVPGAKDKVRKVVDRVGTAVNNQKKAAEGNNGISQKYLATLFVPLGLTSNTLDPFWVAAIDSFADKIGAYAHTSRSYIHAQPKNLNPHDVLLDVNRIIFQDPRLPLGSISSLESFDAWARTLISSGKAGTHVHKRQDGILKHLLWWLIRFVDRYSR